MRHVLSTSLALLVVFPAFAADPKPNTLTPKEIANGCLLLFDGETMFGWNAVGEVRVADGVLRVGGQKEARLELTSTFGDYDLEFQYRSEGTGFTSFRSTRAGGAYGFLSSEEPGWHRALFSVRSDPAKGELKTTYLLFSPGNVQKPESSDHLKGRAPGWVAFQADPGGRLLLRSVKLRPHGLASIFNGKDLSGWKEHPGRKSKFSVTKEGWLNVKDGPGDLQTEGQWANFVLQLECISNGKHLNSGIFFRCRPNEYQNGYEAQIRNQFTEAPTQKYVIEEYDSKTHELTGKKEVLSPAVDYGTGAIYRRQPARRGVAKDGEWFTLTVVAHGRHFATWVNGIQVTDWTDHRKPNDNARNGYRAEKGPISIQGHDPTTDLSFRNLRIAELP